MNVKKIELSESQQNSLLQFCFASIFFAVTLNSFCYKGHFFIFIMTWKCSLMKFGTPKHFVPRLSVWCFAGDCWQGNKRNITVIAPQICFYLFMMIGYKIKGKLSSKQNVVNAISDLKRTSALLAKKTLIMLLMSSSTKRNLLKQRIFI